MGVPVTFTEEQVRAIRAMDMGLIQKHDPASLTLTAPALHGPFQGNANQFGLFSDASARPQRWSALARSPKGIFSLATLRKSEYVKERLDLMSGVTAASGTNAEGWCGNPPTVGQGKVASVDYEWGEFFIKTNLNALPLIGQMRRGEVPGEILNAPREQRNPLVPDLVYEIKDARSQLQYEMFLIGVHTERILDIVSITGDNSQASNATEVGFMTEPDGLDRQIKTGYIDARTGIAVPAADSAVVSFNADVGGTASDGRNAVLAVSDTVWGLRDRAASMGMDGVVHAIAMRKEAFRSMVDVWACNYATYRCTSTNAGQPFVNDTRDTNQLRLEMMNGQYLLVDNIAVPVVFSEGIPQESLGGNQFKSDLYVVPVSWAGIPLLSVEYFPMDNQYLTEFAGFLDPDRIATLNNGLWIASSRSAGLCDEYLFGAKFRLILETPWLAGRVDDIRYTFRAPIRNSSPSDTWFYANGGATYGS